MANLSSYVYFYNEYCILIESYLVVNPVGKYGN